MSDHIIYVMLAFKDALYRERRQKLQLLVCLGIATVFLILFADRQTDKAVAQLMIIAALISGVGSLFFLKDILKFWNPNSSPLLELLQAPQNIVWVYLLKVELTPFGIRFRKENIFCLRLLNGEMMQVRIPDDETAILMENLEKLLPRAAFGYSKEKEQLYEIHPELLLKD